MAGCGDDDTRTAREVVADLNEEGAGLVLGDPLAASPGVRTYGLELREEEAPHAEEGHGHAGGSIAEYPNRDAAAAELRNCERSAAASGSLYCMAVGNVLVILGGDMPPDEVAPVRRAALALGD